MLWGWLVPPPRPHPQPTQDCALLSPLAVSNQMALRRPALPEGSALRAATAWDLGQCDFQTHLQLQGQHVALATWEPADGGCPF